MTDLGLQYAAQGAKSELAPGFVGQFATGETLTITYTEPDGTTEAVIFTAAANPTAENQIPDDSFSGSFTAYWNAIRDKVGAHHRISPFFTVTRSSSLAGTILRIKCKSADPDWEIVTTNTAGITVTDFAPTVDTTPINYKVLFEVFVERTYKGGDYVQAAQLENIPDSDGYMSFDISSILEAECKAGMAEPVVPEWGTADSFLADNLRRYYVRYTEEYGTPVVAQEWQYDEVRTCMNGGVSQSIYATGDWLADLNVDNALLTWMPNGRKVGRAQPEYISFYNWDSVEREVFVRMRWYDIADNAVSTPSGHLTALLLQPNEVATLPVGPEVLGLNANFDAYRYDVQVVYNDGEAYQPLSQWRTYLLDDDNYHSERYIQYLNGFGVVETWRCTGVWGKKINIQRAIAERPLLPDFNEFATDRFQYQKNWDHELTYRTGYVTRGEADVLQEMLIGGEVYDVAEEGHIPLTLETNSFAVTDTDQDLHAYQFAARPRMDTRNYSKKNITDLMAGAWQEPGGEAWFDAFTVPWSLP